MSNLISQLQPTAIQHRLSKFKRQPDRIGIRRLTERSLNILATIERYRFLPTSLLLRLVPGDSRTTHDHLQWLYHTGLVNRFALSRIGSEFNYYLDNSEALDLLV